MAFGDRPLIRITGGAMFWMFMMALLGCATYVWISHPPSVLTQVLSGTSEERQLRNLQDPLAMRLWVLNQAYVGDTVSRKALAEQIIRQWEGEVKSLGKDAYHTKAADMSWNLKNLEITEEQRKALSETNARVVEQQVKPSW
jgi:hypothetical protein